MAGIRYVRMAAAAILSLFPMVIFNILPTLQYRSQPPYKISCQYLNPWLNYNNFLKFKIEDDGCPQWRLSAILELLQHHIRTPTKPLRGAASTCHLSNFVSIRCIVLKIWGFEFLHNWHEMPITPPKFRFWGPEPLNVISHYRDHIRHIFGRNRTTWRFWWRSVHWCDLDASWRNQKTGKKKTRGKNKLDVSPDHRRWPSERYVVLHAGWSSGACLLSIEFRQNRLNGFRDMGGRFYSPFPILWPVASLYNSDGWIFVAMLRK